jgi:hypothetical protein
MEAKSMPTWLQELLEALVPSIFQWLENFIAQHLTTPNATPTQNAAQAKTVVRAIVAKHYALK